MDGSAVGRGCVALVLSVVYRTRALPLVWLVRRGEKGHFAQEDHIALVDPVRSWIPQGTNVTFLGDGEFDGTGLQETLQTYGWSYVFRTAKNIQLSDGQRTFSYQSEATRVREGTYLSFPQVFFTAQAYGPVHALIWWEEGYQEPLFLVTNLPNAAEAVRQYRRRFRIETFFSDQKSRGFHLHKSHLSDPDRLSRLMIPACLAYLWIIFLGVIAQQDGWVAKIHRGDRCDLSLFQLGLRLLDYFLNPNRVSSWRFESG
jgi:hypothetical protein